MCGIIGGDNTTCIQLLAVSTVATCGTNVIPISPVFDLETTNTNLNCAICGPNPDGYTINSTTGIVSGAYPACEFGSNSINVSCSFETTTPCNASITEHATSALYTFDVTCQGVFVSVIAIQLNCSFVEVSWQYTTSCPVNYTVFFGTFNQTYLQSPAIIEVGNVAGNFTYHVRASDGAQINGSTPLTKTACIRCNNIVDYDEVCDSTTSLCCNCSTGQLQSFGYPCNSEFCTPKTCNGVNLICAYDISVTPNCTISSLCFDGICNETSQSCQSVPHQFDSTVCDIANHLPNAGTCYAGDICGQSNVGVCQYGTIVCAPNGNLTCQGAIYPTTEIADGLDNDCDGVVDEGFNVTCSVVGDCPAHGCASVTCNATNYCDYTILVGNACNDSNTCTFGDVCDISGACVGTLVDCADGNVCTDDTCTNGVCQFTDNGLCHPLLPTIDTFHCDIDEYVPVFFSIPLSVPVNCSLCGSNDVFTVDPSTGNLYASKNCSTYASTYIFNETCLYGTGDPCNPGNLTTTTATLEVIMDCNVAPNITNLLSVNQINCTHVSVSWSESFDDCTSSLAMQYVLSYDAQQITIIGEQFTTINISSYYGQNLAYSVVAYDALNASSPLSSPVYYIAYACGCDNVPNSGLVIDACGVCGGNNSTCAGCDNVPNSGLVFDACNVCNGTNSTCLDCDGIPNGPNVPTCPTNCSYNGECVCGNTCVCNIGYVGPFCDITMYCGNNIIDIGEQCDGQSCCNSTSCELYPNNCFVNNVCYFNGQGNATHKCNTTVSAFILTPYGMFNLFLKW